MDTKRKNIAVFCCLCLMAVLAMFIWNTASKHNQQSAAILSGFASNVDVEYTLRSGGKTLYEASAKTDDDGNLKLLYTPHSYDEKKPIIHDFKIKDNKDTLNVLLKNQGDSFVISGGGAQQFSDFTINANGQKINSKTDWAGLFEQKITAQNAKNFKIALYGTGNLTFPKETKQSPAIIEVLSADGGGGRDGSGVNVFEASPSPLSTSDSSAVHEQTNKIVENLVKPLMLMAEQLSVVSMYQTMIIGQFFDAKMQMETQRTYQVLKAEAVKDYHPSEEMCQIGSFMRSVADTEAKANADKMAINEMFMARYTNEKGSSAAKGASLDMRARLKEFRTIYCDPKDNNDGLGYMCDHDQDRLNLGDKGASDPMRMNKDIDYFRTLEFPQTVDIHFQDDALSPDEQDVLALARNLYWPVPFDFPATAPLRDKQKEYTDARNILALNNIAHNSYATLASMKGAADIPDNNVEPGWMFMKTMMRDFGITDDEIEQWVGQQPSYWAQMDILTKKMYQSPNFYTNLYDKPVNVERIGVALDAIRLMQMRDHYTSSLRREMVNSAMVKAEMIQETE